VEGARRLALGIDHACAATSADVLCWGSNEFEQLGRGGETGALESSPTPSAVVGLGAVSAIASGDGFTCAIEGGKTRCLGRNDVGQLGDGTTEKAPDPVTVAFTDDPTAIAIAAGDDHACAVLDDGEVWCWGSNLFGQIDANARFISSSSPMQIDLSGAPLGDVVSIEAGARHTCARRSDSTVVCWGAAGSLCDPFGTGANVAPRMFGWFGVRARAIATGDRHSCALREDRQVQCLGDNQLGQSFPSMPSAFCEHDDPITILP
jgi:alpha-tubulin suppressor-like RCC1 family protein